MVCAPVIATAVLYVAVKREGERSNQSIVPVAAQGEEPQPAGQALGRHAWRAGWRAASSTALAACWLVLALPGSSRLRRLRSDDAGIVLMVESYVVLLLIIVSQLAVAVAAKRRACQALLQEPKADSISACPPPATCSNAAV